jgi:hypothetical protein
MEIFSYFFFIKQQKLTILKDIFATMICVGVCAAPHRKVLNKKTDKKNRAVA